MFHVSIESWEAYVETIPFSATLIQFCLTGSSASGIRLVSSFLRTTTNFVLHEISSETQYLNEWRQKVTCVRKISIHYFSSNDDRTD